MKLNDLHVSTGIEPKSVLVLRHRPFEPRFRKILPWLAAERPDLYNAYQQTQGEKLEKSMVGAGYVASFIGHEPGKAIFVGLYGIGQSQRLTFEEYWQVVAYNEMKALGMRGFTEEDGRSSILFFNLALTDFYAQWKGKLVVGWPPPERSWWRRAHKNDIPVLAILEESALAAGMPLWDEIGLTWDQLAVLPSRWRTTLSQWRGIYFIFDAADGKGYVGSAYGTDNILGRWLNYSTSGHGGNRRLKGRDHRNFQFSILQRVSPDMSAEDVIRLEAKWKERLHTRYPHGLNDN
ncbi:GIY-YIG nuclease family protein [Mesorhizobium sp.]|uniref:GIY-YIG nuclease family protein n=1 Tax=Mesorhizobium sp. TaxID=1871066 RepID=UPI000FE8492C|nr:GIY-YIG nuclease family protein [Mesorhizobium sp.]RWQ56879.1 MAG: GIY-YIG nuclease family protein [Mesorhizobium sp.]